MKYTLSLLTVIVIAAATSVLSNNAQAADLSAKDRHKYTVWCSGDFDHDKTDLNSKKARLTRIMLGCKNLYEHVERKKEYFDRFIAAAEEKEALEKAN